MMKSIAKLTEKDLNGKKVLLRVDFNVPVENGKIMEIYRINAAKETIDYLLSRGAIIALLSHITAIKSFEPVFNQIKKILGRDMKFISDCIGLKVKNNLNQAKPEDMFFLDNIRSYDGEEKNDKKFSKTLASPFDIYINDAFSASHRAHASVAAISKFLPSYAGLLMIKEVENLNKILKLPKKNKTLVIGGAKIETKFPVIKNFLDKAENILVGGAVANVFLKAGNTDIKRSLVDNNFLNEAKKLLTDSNIIVPKDYIFSNDTILDIGPKTISKFSEIIKSSKIIIWNGPLGKTEVNKFTNGTRAIAESIVSTNAFSVVGGGDTIAFIEKNNFINKFSFVSTGGGAMLEFLASNKLPGLEALNYYEP